MEAGKAEDVFFFFASSIWQDSGTLDMAAAAIMRSGLRLRADGAVSLGLRTRN